MSLLLTALGDWWEDGSDALSVVNPAVQYALLEDAAREARAQADRALIEWRTDEAQHGVWLATIAQARQDRDLPALRAVARYARDVNDPTSLLYLPSDNEDATAEALDRDTAEVREGAQAAMDATVSGIANAAGRALNRAVNGLAEGAGLSRGALALGALALVTGAVAVVVLTRKAG